MYQIFHGLIRYVLECSVPYFYFLNDFELGRVALQVDVDLVEECMCMIGGLQSVARTQSSQYMLNDANWVCHVSS